ncbi:TIP41-like protein [Leptinotarsa decemlineata]|uniref:TIP41-like protein n=1 Tax=Leptinotarsa decemlineata TaxID=7539 RepID=UPI000C25587B|nr:TIP41-like protein [Leptinotarsa decemlineata]
MGTISNAEGEIEIQRLPVNSEEHTFNGWTVKYTKSHILHSICRTSEKCKVKSEEQCLLCLYESQLELPHLPEMVFPNNRLILTHKTGAFIEFNALDALRQVCNGKEYIKVEVAYSETWKESRLPENLGQKIKPFDWTFSSDYRGTVHNSAVITPTEERINMEKLKEKEKILFYQELMLYEDELHDNGISSCTLKIRVMPSSFFVLLRFFLRVDNVMVRVNDTRVFHDFSTDYVLREYTNKECGVNELSLPLTVFGDPNLLSPHMPLRTAIYEKITFPATKLESTGSLEG